MKKVCFAFLTFLPLAEIGYIDLVFPVVPEAVLVAYEVGLGYLEFLLHPGLEGLQWDGARTQLSHGLIAEPGECPGKEAPALLVENSQENHPEPQTLPHGLRYFIQERLQLQVGV